MASQQYQNAQDDGENDAFLQELEEVVEQKKQAYFDSLEEQD